MWCTFTARIAALIFMLLPLAAFGQQFPTIPDHSVLGRVGTGSSSGPSQSVPFALLFNNIPTNSVLPSALAQIAGGTVLGNTGTTTDNVGATAAPVLGIPGTTAGSVCLANLTSGTVCINPATGALGTAVATLASGTYNIVGDSLSQTLTNKTFNCANNTCTVRLGSDVTGTLLAANFGALTGDVTNSVGSYATTISAAAVTYAKMQNVAASRLLGNPTGSPASPSEISLGSTLAFSGTSVQTNAFTGDVTTSANSFATTIVANAVTNAKMATMNAWTIKMNNTSGSATPTDITIDGLTVKASPTASDEIPIWDAAASAMKKATVSSIASAGSVSSIAGNTGAFTLSHGITNSVNDIQLSLTNTTLQASPSNPASTTSATGVMMGLGATCHLTPTYSTRIHANLRFNIASGTAAAVGTALFKFGTGTAPANAAAITGTSVGTSKQTVGISGVSTAFAEMTIGGNITGLSAGTAYWFDAAVTSPSSATIALTSVDCDAFEY